MGLYKEFLDRGMIAQATDAEAVEKLLETERQMEIAVTMKHKERRYER